MLLQMEPRNSQTIAPQIVEFAQLLQMTSHELSEYVDNNILENPMLEKAEPSERAADIDALQRLQWLGKQDRGKKAISIDDETYGDLFAAPSSEKLFDVLTEQLDAMRLKPALDSAAALIISCLTEDGYLEDELEQLARQYRWTPELASKALKMVQSMEPAGVGASSVSECLALQLERKGECGLPLTIVRDYLEDFGAGHFHLVSEKTGATRSEIAAAGEIIRSLEPHPGAAYGDVQASTYIIPDYIVYRNGEEIKVLLANWSEPELKISGYYESMLGSTDDAEVKKYLSQNARRALNLIGILKKRHTLMQSIGEFIVERQKEFFLHGASKMQPMILEDVAETLEVHQSTISRAVRGKYLQCSLGTFPLSFFFGRKIDTDTDAGVSSRAIKEIIKNLIAGEDPGAPLSDQQLYNRLAKQGIQISRRGIAKYRSEMGIASSTGRRNRAG